MPEADPASSGRQDGDPPALPPANTRRWVARRKALVVEAIQSGRLSLDEAWRRYRLSVEEFGAWKRAFCRFGVQCLRVAGAATKKTSRHRARRALAGGGGRHG
ncbi:MAG: hypothetical protein JWO81_1419 [Alphaproteobacteria bacterium]|nr:hypothetical protein [Alphaproteobacteria bacterium]